MKTYRAFSIWNAVKANAKRKNPKKLVLEDLQTTWNKDTGHSPALLKRTVNEMLQRGLLIEHGETGYAIPEKL